MTVVSNQVEQIYDFRLTGMIDNFQTTGRSERRSGPRDADILAASPLGMDTQVTPWRVKTPWRISLAWCHVRTPAVLLNGARERGTRFSIGASGAENDLKPPAAITGVVSTRNIGGDVARITGVPTAAAKDEVEEDEE